MNTIIEYLTIFFCSAIAVLPFFILARIVFIKKIASEKQILNPFHEIGFAALICWGIGLFVLTLGIPGFDPLKFNFIPFHIVYDITVGCFADHRLSAAINVLGNILMFVPIGFLSALLWRKSSLKRSLAVTAAYSLFIEITQIFLLVRVTDIDDIIMNTTGGAAGYLFYLLLRRLFPRLCEIFLVKNK